MLDYLLTLRVSESTKELYLQRLRQFGLWLLKNDIRSFNEVKAFQINLFLSNYQANNTKNGYITALRPFFRFLNKPMKLEYYPEELESILPSDVLSVDEVIAIANKAGERRDMYKVIILSLFESCARVNEHLHLKAKGDVQFSSVIDKKGKRKLIATLFYKRAKGKVPKEPITLVMFASELQRYLNSHSDEWLFPSPQDASRPISKDTVEYVLWNAGDRLGIKKRLNPHWLRHSGLSYFANEMNYNEEKLKHRANWKTTAMARRYIHSGAEDEKKKYLEGMGLLETEKETTKIMSKTCLHCGSPQPHTNSHCDVCAYPLDLEEYEKTIEKRRNVEGLYTNLDKIYAGKLSDEQKAELGNHSETIRQLAEMGRDDLAKEYIEKLLESWVKAFLTR